LRGIALDLIERGRRQMSAPIQRTALYTRVATKTISEVLSPLEHIALRLKEIRPPG
jgi:hypothetical protein